MGFRPVGQPDRKTVTYARVSSKDQQADLQRQAHVLERYCASQGWIDEVISDLGSGMNCQQKSLKRLLDGIVNGEVEKTGSHPHRPT